MVKGSRRLQQPVLLLCTCAGLRIRSALFIDVVGEDYSTVVFEPGLQYSNDTSYEVRMGTYSSKVPSWWLTSKSVRALNESVADSVRLDPVHWDFTVPVKPCVASLEVDTIHCVHACDSNAVSQYCWYTAHSTIFSLQSPRELPRTYDDARRISFAAASMRTILA